MDKKKKEKLDSILKEVNAAFGKGIVKYADDVKKGTVEGIHDIAGVDPDKADDHLK